jgi:hypothetical protein
MSFLPPVLLEINSPFSVNVSLTAPVVATLFITSAFLASDAFNSITPQPKSYASACAAEVFPIPGSPARITAFLSTLPFSQA